MLGIIRPGHFWGETRWRGAMICRHPKASWSDRNSLVQIDRQTYGHNQASSHQGRQQVVSIAATSLVPQADRLEFPLGFGHNICQTLERVRSTVCTTKSNVANPSSELIYFVSSTSAYFLKFIECCTNV